MKYLVIYNTDKERIVSRVGPFNSFKEADAVRSKIHPSRTPFIAEERKTLPKEAELPTPLAYKVILQKEIWLHKGIAKLYEVMGKKQPFKTTWIKVE